MAIAGKLVASLRRRPSVDAALRRPAGTRGAAASAPKSSARGGAEARVPAGPVVGGVVSCETGLSCLFLLGIQNGVHADVGAVRRRNVIDGPTLPVSRLAALAAEFGLKAE